MSIQFRKNVEWAMENHPAEFEQMFLHACQRSYKPLMLKQPGQLGVDILVEAVVGYEYVVKARPDIHRVWAWDGKSARTLARTMRPTSDSKSPKVLVRGTKELVYRVTQWLADRGWSYVIWTNYKNYSNLVMPSLESDWCTQCPNYLHCVLTNEL